VSLPVDSPVVLTLPTHPTAYTRDETAAGKWHPPVVR